jgi:nucleotide-binding universal stress UspA family protein
LLGTVAEKIVRHACCPVLTVASHRTRYRETPHYRKILAAYDFSDYSIAAVLHAKELALRFGARLLVLYVHAQQVHPSFIELWKLSVVEDLPELVENTRKTLVRSLGKDGLLDPEVFVERGKGDRRVSEIIVDFAERHLVDLIVMGTHGLTGIERALLGSTTERVARTAHSPVLTIHRCRAQGESDEDSKHSLPY